MAEDYIAFDKSEKKRKPNGSGGDRKPSKRQRRTRQPEQSGANAMPLGQRSSGGTNTPAEAQENAEEAVPTSISRPHVKGPGPYDRPPPDMTGWSDKRKKKEAEKRKWRNRERDLVHAVLAAEKAGIYKDEPVRNKKKLRSDGNVALDESRTYYELWDGTIDKGEAHEYLARINDAEAPFAEHLPADMDEADRALRRAKKEKRALCPADEFVLKVARMNPSKGKKEKRKRAEANEKIVANPYQESQPTVTEVVEREVAKEEGEGEKKRFICFVGQLPFTCATADIEKHFESVAPNSIRHMTHKEGGQSKGYAFLEFDSWDRMKTCLKLYHHSEFNDGKSNPRKINIELTSGGGGNSEARKDDIKTKNEKLDQERKKNYDKRKSEKSGGKDSKAPMVNEDGKPMNKWERKMAKFAEDHRYTKTMRKKMERKRKKEVHKKEVERQLIDKIKVEKKKEILERMRAERAAQTVAAAGGKDGQAEA